jgi:hypothetical protein
MRRVLMVFMGAMLTLGLGATTALAQNPHIVGAPSASVSGNTLTLSASVAGLGNVETATFTLSGTVEVFSRCYTKSGNRPQAANKRETITVSETRTFPVRNGRTNATFTVTPLSTLECPPGQRAVIESVTYDLALVYEGETLFTFTS